MGDSTRQPGPLQVCLDLIRLFLVRKQTWDSRSSGACQVPEMKRKPVKGLTRCRTGRGGGRGVAADAAQITPEPSRGKTRGNVLAVLSVPPCPERTLPCGLLSCVGSQGYSHGFHAALTVLTCLCLSEFPFLPKKRHLVSQRQACFLILTSELLLIHSMCEEECGLTMHIQRALCCAWCS